GRDGRAAAASSAETAAPAALGRQPAGTLVAACVLLVAVDVIGHGVVHRDVVHLPVGQAHVVPGDAAVDGHADAAVERHRHAVGIGRVNPHVVGIAAGAGGEAGEGVAAVERVGEGVAEEIQLVGVVAGDRVAGVVMGAAAQVAVAARQGPALAAVVGAPQLADLGGGAVLGHAVAGLDQRVHPVRVAGGDREADLAQRRMRQPAAAQPRPGLAAVGGFENAAARSAAGAAPGVD